MLNLSNSYFSIPNPLHIIERWLHPYRHSVQIHLNQKPLKISWTQRAQHVLQQRKNPVIAEIQLYFSCVIKKRVLFHEQADIETIPVNDNLHIFYQPVLSESCNPDDFAKYYPVGISLTHANALKMVPSRLYIDYKDQQWLASLQV